MTSTYIFVASSNLKVGRSDLLSEKDADNEQFNRAEGQSDGDEALEMKQKCRVNAVAIPIDGVSDAERDKFNFLKDFVTPEMVILGCRSKWRGKVRLQENFAFVMCKNQFGSLFSKWSGFATICRAILLVIWQTGWQIQSTIA